MFIDRDCEKEIIDEYTYYSVTGIPTTRGVLREKGLANWDNGEI